MGEDYKSTWTACTLQDPDNYSIPCEDTSIDCEKCPIYIKEQEQWEKDKDEHEAEMKIRFPSMNKGGVRT